MFHAISKNYLSSESSELIVSGLLFTLEFSQYFFFLFQDALMNRSSAFAETVVITVCPVILAIALNKVDLKKEEHGRHAVPIAMLIVAAVTLTSGTVPSSLSASLRGSPTMVRPVFLPR